MPQYISTDQRKDFSQTKPASVSRRHGEGGAYLKPSIAHQQQQQQQGGAEAKRSYIPFPPHECGAEAERSSLSLINNSGESACLMWWQLLLRIASPTWCIAKWWYFADEPRGGFFLFFRENLNDAIFFACTFESWPRYGLPFFSEAIIRCLNHQIGWCHCAIAGFLPSCSTCSPAVHLDQVHVWRYR